MLKFNQLSKAEMKNVLGGTDSNDGDGGDGGGDSCSTSNCTLNVEGTVYHGTCGVSGGYNQPCLCQTSYGNYTPSSGTSHCVV